jgi:hypothetical protein
VRRRRRAIFRLDGDIVRRIAALPAAVSVAFWRIPIIWCGVQRPSAYRR